MANLYINKQMSWKKIIVYQKFFFSSDVLFNGRNTDFDVVQKQSPGCVLLKKCS